MKLKIEDLKQKQHILYKVDLSVNDKLTYSLKRLLKRIEQAVKPVIDQVQEVIADFTIGQAATDEKGILIQEGDRNSFTPEARRAIMKFVTEQHKIFDQTEVVVEPYSLIDLKAAGFQRAAIVFDDFDVEELTGLLF